MECDLGSCFPHQFNRIVDPSLIDELIIKIDDLECAFKANLCEACKRCCTPLPCPRHPSDKAWMPP